MVCSSRRECVSAARISACNRLHVPPNVAARVTGVPLQFSHAFQPGGLDRAAHLRSQLFTFNGRKLATWQHPKEIDVRRQDGWTIDDLDAALHDADQRVHIPQF